MFRIEPLRYQPDAYVVCVELSEPSSAIRGVCRGYGNAGLLPRAPQIGRLLVRLNN